MDVSPRNYAMTYRLLAYTTGLALLILTALSCGGPYVEHSTISPEVLDTDHWRIVWEGRTDSTRTAEFIMANTDERAEYTLVEYCVRYVHQVKELLQDEHEVSFAENFPGRGTIAVELHGTTISRYLPPSTDANRRLRGDPDEPGDLEGSYSGGTVVGATDVIFTDRDKVDSVVVTIHDAAGKLAGKAMINADEVRPGHVAEVIHALITEGRYEEAPLKLKLD
jgi:hypothetical protein